MQKNIFKKFLSLGILTSFTLLTSSYADFHEDWSQGISPKRWVLYRKVWGTNNNGVVPELVSIQKDTVDGVQKNVVVLTCQGNLTNSTIMGVKKVSGGYATGSSPQRVGAVLATTDYYASGTYDVKMKIGNPKSAPTSPPTGMTPAIWFFHYEEHYPSPSDTTGSKINPLDPQFQPRYKEGASGSYYSTVNSEIDMPELGINSHYNTGGYTTYISEITDTHKDFNYSNFGINVMDGKYHTYRTVWHTALVPTALTDSQVIPRGAYYYAADSATSSIQGFPVIKKSDGVWYAYEGVSATFFVDGIQVGSITTNVSPVAARLTIGGWFPTWAGVPNWDVANLYISDVTLTSSHDEGDVLYQPESFPLDGLVPPRPSLYFGT